MFIYNVTLLIYSIINRSLTVKHQVSYEPGASKDPWGSGGPGFQLHTVLHQQHLLSLAP